MPALAIILTAAMVVPGDGPEKALGEMVRERQPLDLKGEWKAVVYHHGEVSKGKAKVQGAKVEQGLIQFLFREYESDRVFAFGKPVDEGGGNLQMEGLLGIYEQDGDRLRICLNCTYFKRPTSFQPGDEEYLFILHRVKSPK